MEPNNLQKRLGCLESQVKILRLLLLGVGLLFAVAVLIGAKRYEVKKFGILEADSVTAKSFHLFDPKTKTNRMSIFIKRGRSEVTEEDYNMVEMRFLNSRSIPTTVLTESHLYMQYPNRTNKIAIKPVKPFLYPKEGFPR
jgi:hypothetical protein